MIKIIVTTSWDDGHVLDIKLAELLRKYNIKGTFYISPENREISQNERLTKEQIVELSKDFEIGAHTMTHPRLSKIDNETARKEIITSKQTLENWLGVEVKSFCYPGGDYKPVHEKIVSDAGFSIARTVKCFSIDAGNNPFEMPTTVHVYHRWLDIIKIIKEVGLLNFISYYLNWDNLAIAMFDKVFKNGGVFHLWGHSWEIEKNKDWVRLERVLKYISNRAKVTYEVNGKLI